MQQGESFEITDRGRPVAMLVPHVEDSIERMIAEGRIRPPTRDWRDLPPPVPPTPGVPLPSEILAEERAEDR